MRIFVSLSLLVGAVVLHFVAVYSGIYDAQLKGGFVWFDNVLHALIGIGFGLMWVWFLRQRSVSRTQLYASLFGFVLLLAILWEVSEFIFFKIFSSFALGLKVYSPSLTEATWDISSNLIGALLCIAYLFNIRNPQALSPGEDPFRE